MRPEIDQQILRSNTVFFDYDGLIVDSEKLYYKTWCRILLPVGQLKCKENYRGRMERENYNNLKSYLKIPNQSYRAVSSVRKYLLKKYIKTGNLHLLVGIKKLIIHLSKKKKLVVISNSSKNLVRLGFKENGLNAYFKDYFCFSEKKKAKPDPFLYIEALQKLNLSPSNVFAIEDSISGITAAINAGILVICINTEKEVGNWCNNNNIVYFETAKKFNTYLTNLEG